METAHSRRTARKNRTTGTTRGDCTARRFRRPRPDDGKSEVLCAVRSSGALEGGERQRGEGKCVLKCRHRYPKKVFSAKRKKRRNKTKSFPLYSGPRRTRGVAAVTETVNRGADNCFRKFAYATPGGRHDDGGGERGRAEVVGAREFARTKKKGRQNGTESVCIR